MEKKKNLNKIARFVLFSLFYVEDFIIIIFFLIESFSEKLDLI